MDGGLRAEVAQPGFQAADLRVQTVPFGRRALLLGGHLADERLLLPREGVQDGGVDVFAVGGDLVGGHAQEGLPLFNELTLLDVDGADGALLRREDLGRAGGGRQVARDRFLAGVLREEEEGDYGRRGGHDEPHHEPGGQRLERHDAAPMAVLLLEVDDFPAEQGGPGRNLLTHDAALLLAGRQG